MPICAYLMPGDLQRDLSVHRFLKVERHQLTGAIIVAEDVYWNTTPHLGGGRPRDEWFAQFLWCWVQAARLEGLSLERACNSTAGRFGLEPSRVAKAYERIDGRIEEGAEFPSSIKEMRRGELSSEDLYQSPAVNVSASEGPTIIGSGTQMNTALRKSPPLTREDAAQYITVKTGLRTTAGSLARRATKGTGPKYRLLFGRAVYDLADLEQWLEEQSKGQRRASPPKLRVLQ